MNSRMFNFQNDIAISVDEINSDNIIVEDNITKDIKNINKRNTYVVLVEKIIKRVIDIIAGIVGVILLIPLTAIVYFMNKIMKEEGPIFYTQDRIGQDGKIFKMYKYRSMVVGADEKLKIYLAENEEARKEYKKFKKLKNDPRVTKIGNILRKTSLDEMPQLINLLKGDMSLVGARPYLPREQEEMGTYYDIIVKGKPGITGYWQISGRSNVTFEDRLDMDVYYSKTHTLKEDISILWKTFKQVARGLGAR